MNNLNLHLRYDAVDEDLPIGEPNLIRVGKKVDNKMMTGYVNQYGIEVVPCKYYTRDYRFVCGLLSLYDDNQKIGYINVNGDFIYQCQFDSVTEFKDNLCGVGKYDGHLTKWGMIDNKGNLIVNYKYSTLIVVGHNCVIAQDAYLPNRRGCGLLDYKGNEITPFVYKQLGPMLSDGTIEYVALNGEHGLMDVNGNHLEVLPY